MDFGLSAIWRNWLPTLPATLRTSLLAGLGLTENAEHQDVLTQIIVANARPILQTPAALKRSQEFFNTDWPVVGRMWVSKFTIPVSVPAGQQSKLDSAAAAALDVRDAVEFAITKLSPDYLRTAAAAAAAGEQSCPCEVSGVCAVETEWTAFRPRALPVIEPLPLYTQAKLYQRMMDDVPLGGPTILYMHGGAHVLMDPVTHRFTTSSLAREAGGRVLSVRYRLSPQSVFPAALTDAFVAYLALLAPPVEGAFHEAVPSGKIVLAGDSSGGGIAAALMLLLVTLARETVSVRWQGRDVMIPSPPCAGLAVASPWLDISRCLPSCTENSRWDIIAPPPHTVRCAEGKESWISPTPAFPPDEIWPARPPRAETYCEAKMVGHPLVSPLAASKGLWRGSPDVWVSVGWEGMQDEAEVFARRVHGGGSGGRVVFAGYEGMPHCFGVVPWTWAGWDAMKSWGRFCRAVVSDGGGGGDAEDQQVLGKEKRSVATWTRSKTKEVKEVRVEDLGMTQMGCGYERRVPLTDEEVDRRIEGSVRWRVEFEEHLVREWRRTSQKLGGRFS